MHLIFDQVWDELIDDWEYAPRHVAVAYFSCDSGLWFESGDTLIVDASDDAIRRGQTDAKALRRAVKSGARVFSHDGLHAKIFVLGQRIFVGSANASLSSRERLAECVAWSEDPHAVAEGIRFIRALRREGKEVDVDFLKRIEAIPVERRGPRAAKRRQMSMSSGQCWLLGVGWDKAYPGDEAAVDERTEELQVTLGGDGEEFGWFWWPLDNSKFVREVKVGDLVIEIDLDDWYKPNPRNVAVYKHGLIREIKQGPQDKTFHVSWGNDGKKGEISWREFCKLMGIAGWKSRPSFHACREIAWDVSQRLYRLWPN
jgi:hypothetical protein